MQLGQRTISKGDNRRITIDYRDWLDEGRHLTAVIPTISPAQSSVSAATLDDAHVRAYFFIQAGQVNEIFTVTVQAASTDGQIVTDTLAITIQ